MGYVYGIQSGRYIKVGVAQHLQGRLHTFRLHNPHPLKIVLRRTVANDYWVEKRMHQLLDKYAIGREWFDCSQEQVREAFEQALKDLAAHNDQQDAWEKFSAARAEKRKVPIGRPAKLGTERGTRDPG